MSKKRRVKSVTFQLWICEKAMNVSNMACQRHISLNLRSIKQNEHEIKTG